MYQTDVVQAFVHGALNDVDIYIQPPARYACTPGSVLKLRKAVYGLHQAVTGTCEVQAGSDYLVR